MMFSLHKFKTFLLLLLVSSNYSIVFNPLKTIRNKGIVTLLIDNYDSYTYNIWQLLAEINGVDPIVIFNDQFNSWEDLLLQSPHFDNIVISPGPGNPAVNEDFGICKEAIEKCTGEN